MSAGPGETEPLQRIDLHTHTHYSPDGITSPRRFVETCRRKRLTVHVQDGTFPAQVSRQYGF